jgi:transposase
MSQKSSAPPARVPAEKLVRDIRRATRKHHSAENEIRVVLEGLCSNYCIENIEK